MTIRASVVAAAWLLATSLAASAGEFQYVLPAGWLDLQHTYIPATGNSVDTSNVPLVVKRESVNGNFAMYAIHQPSTTADALGASVNAVEMQSTGRFTVDTVRGSAESAVADLQAAGYKAAVIDAEIRKVNGVKSGIATVDVEGGSLGPRRMRQYLITGRKTSTVLTFSAPVDDFERHAATFEAMAAGTQGAYDPNTYDWKRGVMVFFGVGGTAALASIAIGLVRRRRDLRERALEAEANVVAADGADAPPPVAPVARKPAAQAASKYVWTCEACGNPVPIRLDECRCGGKKPG